MLIGKGLTPIGDAYGVVQEDTFRTIRGHPFDGVEPSSGQTFPLSEVRLSPPVAPPMFLVVLGGSIRPEVSDNPSFLGDFVQPPGSVRPVGDPRLFTKCVVAPCGPDDEVRIPPDLPSCVLLEPELAVVIGKKVRSVSMEDAMQAVLGFTIFNDVSAGDYLANRRLAYGPVGDLFQAKCADTFASVGPYIRTDLTEKDIDSGLGIEGRVNGRVLLTGNTRNLKYGVSQVVSFASRYKTLYPGDVISFGTPAAAPVVEAGDTMEVEIEGIGVLRNTVR